MLWFLRLFGTFRELEGRAAQLKTDNAILLSRNQYLQAENDRLHLRVEESNEKRFSVVAAVANFETQRHYGVAILPDQMKLPQEVVDRGDEVPAAPDFVTLDQVFNREAESRKAYDTWKDALGKVFKKAGQEEAA